MSEVYSSLCICLFRIQSDAVDGNYTPIGAMCVWDVLDDVRRTARASAANGSITIDTFESSLLFDDGNDT